MQASKVSRRLKESTAPEASMAGDEKSDEGHREDGTDPGEPGLERVVREIQEIHQAQ